MSHLQIFPTTTSISTSSFTTFTTLTGNLLALAANPTATTTNVPALFAVDDPYFPANLLLTSSLPTSTPSPGSNDTALFFGSPTTSPRWFEQPWVPLAVWLLFAYSLASAVMLVWIWCIESWSLNPTVNATYGYRMRQSVVDARTVDWVLEGERWGYWRSLTEQQQEEAMSGVRDQRRYREIADAAARIGTF